MQDSEIMCNLIVERDADEQRLAVARPDQQRDLQGKIRKKDRLIECEDRKRDKAAKVRELRAEERSLKERRTKLIKFIDAKNEKLIDRQQSYETEVARRADAEIEADLTNQAAPLGDDSTLRLQDEIRQLQSTINTAARQKAEIDARLNWANFKKGPLQTEIETAEAEWKDAVAAVAELGMLGALVSFLPALALYIAAKNWASGTSETSHEIEVSEELLSAARDLVVQETKQ